jgi:hypothetical protein
MTEDEMKKKAHQIILDSRPSAEKIAISLFDDFFNGTVAMVDWEDNTQKRRDFVYFNRAGKISHSNNVESFIRSFAGRKTDDVARILYGFGGVVALMIVATTCYIAVIKAPVPEVLSGALTLILGFYFGTVASREKHA